MALILTIMIIFVESNDSKYTTSINIISNIKKHKTRKSHLILYVFT